MMLLRFVRALPLVAVPLLVLVLASVEARAQDTGTVTGRVVDATDMRPLAGVQVHFPVGGRGSLTDAQGRFVILNVPVGRHELRAQRLGYLTGSQTVEVAAGQSAVANIALESRAITMEAVVVTGVAAETPQSQLAFSVPRLNVAETQRVPVPSAATLVQGRVPGAKVVQGSGLPGSEPSLQFRGATSIMGTQEPLIVVDGVITAGGIADLNPQDIESMELVKGAAAAALYGSRAQAGVLQITTRTGSRMNEGRHQFTVRTSFEANDIERTLGFNNSHPFRLNADRTAFVNRQGQPIVLPSAGGAFAFDDGRAGTTGERAFADKPFPGQTYDPMRQFFDPGNRVTTNLSLAGNRGGTQYFLSAAGIREEGAVQLNPPMTQRNVRLNVTQPIGENFRLAVTSFFSDRERFLIEEQGGFLRQLTFVSAAADLLKPDPNEPGGISAVGDPIRIANVGPNPVNRLINTRDQENRVRVMGGFDATYNPLDWLTLEGNFSYDRIDTNRNYFQRPGLGNVSGPPTVGVMRQYDDLREEMNGSVTAGSTRQFGDLTLRSRARWLMERADESGFLAGGQGLPIDEVPRLGIITGAPTIDSYQRSIRSEGVFLVNQFAFRDKYVGDVLVRRDGSSLFGADQRWQNYWRLSGAWRMAQEPWFPVRWINEFKPRYSIGTSGGRPGFAAQYQTFAIERGQVIPRTLGNRDLRPELATEQEFGLDVIIAERFQIEANYVDTKIEDQLLLVPLPSVFGYDAQWQNAGTVESKTWELGLSTALVERPGMVWTARLNLDRTQSTITELNTPPFEITNTAIAGSSRARMMVREGERLGSFYGFKFLSSCADLPAGMPCSQFDVNDYGHLVWVGEGNTWRDGFAKDLWGTTGRLGGETLRWGHPIRPGTSSPLAFTKLGDSQPSLNASLLQDLTWRNFGLTFLLDSEWGAQVYNMTRQWQCRDALCRQADMRDVAPEEKKPVTYFGALQAANLANDFWVEDSDYVKVRELSLRYTLRGNQMPAALRNTTRLSEATINLTGRNLKTWTNYLGFDPEVGRATFGGSAVMGRVDEWFYPNFRSFGIDVQLVF
jgi:TonB-linked SusC/RagA family outer membrane protein